MGTAFTPGLIVSDHTTVRRSRRLPIKGEVLVSVGQAVRPDDILARASVLGALATVHAAQAIGCPPEQLQAFCRLKEGDAVATGEVLAERSVWFGLMVNRCRSPRAGTVEYISKLSGNIGIRGSPRSVGCTAYLAGTIAEIIPEEGAVVEATGALIQGIFGVGGEHLGELCWMAEGNQLTGEAIGEAHRGKILAHPGLIAGSALAAAAAHGVVGLIGAGIVDSELMDFLGFNIGVAITGEENIPFAVMVTEGFGPLTMPARTADLLRSLGGRTASINGATQIRAGVIRPEVIVPGSPGDSAAAAPIPTAHGLEIGARVRLIRRPNFGQIGLVTALPEEPVVIASGSRVRVLSVHLQNGADVVVPRSNVEILAARGG
jgi:hypothetical protein